MKKKLLLLPLVLAGLALNACSKYDDSALSGRVTNVEGRVSKLEEQVKAMNSDIVAIRTLITALETKDYVTKVEPITEGSRSGYRISFTKSNPITIFHGTNGRDGQNGANGRDGVNGTNGRDGVSPVIGVRQEGGIYYWTLNGQWLTDAQGQKVKAQGTDGRNGQDGAPGAPGRDGVNGADGAPGRDGVTPKVRIQNDYWEVSYDNGQTWQSLNVRARGDKGDAGSSFFQSVEPNSKNQPGYVTFVFADGQRVELPTWYEYEKLRTEVGQINRNLQSLQQIVTAVQNRDYLTSVTPYMEASVQRGYTLSFARSGSLVIYHGRNGENGQNGRDGQDGQTPVIGIRKDSDNIYYWTLNGQWLTDAEGRKVKAEGRDGAPGASSSGPAGRDGITPQLKIEGEYWHVSYDNGQTWQSLNVKARGEKGDKGEKGDRGEQGAPGRDGAPGASSANAIFTDVRENDGDVTLTLRNGTNVVIPKGSPIAITFAQSPDIRLQAGKKYSIPYTITGATAQTKIETLAEDGFRAVVKRSNESTGTIEVTAPSTIQEGRVLVFVTDGRERTIMRSIVFFEGAIRIPTKSYSAEFSGGDVVVDVDANIDYSIRIPEVAQSWVSHISTSARAIMRSERLLFRVKPNTTTQERYATIELVDNLGLGSETIVINQRGFPVQATIHVPSNKRLRALIPEQDKNLIEELKLTGTLLDEYGKDNYAFLRSMPKLKKLDLSEISNTTIPPSAFSGANIPNIILPLNLTAIPERAFENSKITSIHIPKTVTSIGQRAFAGTSELRGNIIIPDATTSIGDSAFENSKFDGKLKLGAQLRWIGNGAFRGGDYSSVEWNERLQTIGKHAFASARKVKGDVILPNTLTWLGEGAFAASSFDENLVLSQELKEIPSAAFLGCDFVGKLVIPDKVETISSNAFADCDKMTGSLTIGVAVKRIGMDAFRLTRFSRVYCKAQTPPVDSGRSFRSAVQKYLGVPKNTRESYRTELFWFLFETIEEVDF